MDFLAGWHHWFCCPSRESSPLICLTNIFLFISTLGVQKCTSYCSQFVVPAWPHNVGTCQSDRPPLRPSEGERGNGCGERGGVSHFLVDEHPPRLWTDHSDSQEFCQKQRQPLKNTWLWFVIVSAPSGVIQINVYVTMFNVVLMAMQLFFI